ncbi:MAG: endonuclease/exonuclease/phosphatase family protein [Melioribacteraceae bacterium]|nr:endonuclease/exonuclease/phosphatase family protein [Melioribacteraceae bacterium]
MKLFRLANLILFILLIYSCSSIEQKQVHDKPTELSVMTFNIRLGTVDDGKNNWNNRKLMVAEVISESFPDILCLQEAFKFQIDEIMSLHPNYALIGVGRDDGIDQGEYSCVLYSRDRFIVDSTGNFWLSDTPETPGSMTWGNVFPRICTWAKLFDKFNNKEFFVFNTHLDHQIQLARENGVKLILERMKIVAPELPIILTGDFNSDETNPAIKLVLNNNFTDSYRALNKRTDREGTFNDFKGIENEERIDFIFVNRFFTPIKSEIIRYNRNGLYPSDHFPVISRFK